MGVTLLITLGLATLASAAPYAFPNSTALYPFPNGTATAPNTASSGFVASTGVASLTPTAYPNTALINSTATMMLRPRSTDSICAKPGNLICSMNGKQAGICGFTGDESLQWMDVGEGTECRCQRGLCTIVDVVTYE